MEDRDDLIVNDSYATMSNHSEEEGRAIRKNVLKVTVILSVITAAEIVTGILVGKYLGADRYGWVWETIRYSYIALTIIKALFIVMSFMHLKHETTRLKRYIIVPYTIFIVYMVFLFLIEGFNVFTY